jgi:cardiolipin synthase A/B
MGTVGIVLLFLLIGFLAAFALLDATRGTPISRVVTLDEGPAPAIDTPEFRAAFEALTSTPLRKGHRIDVLANGEVYDRLWRDVRDAREYVAVQMYYCKAGKVADAMREALLDRARAGVETMLLLDAFGSSLDDEFLEPLRTAGVKVAKFRPMRPTSINTAIHRAHVRAVVIDGRVGYTGGFGIDDKWLGDGHSDHGWRDTNVRFEGPAVAQLLAVFTSCWAEATGDLIVAGSWWRTAEGDDAARDGDGALAGLLHGAPTVGSTPAERFFALSLAAARERIWITNSYFVPDDDFRRLVRQAVERGVDVRILTAGEESDVRSTHLAARARYDELLEGGVRIYEYQPSMVHAKTMVVDGAWCTVGTMNTDNRSMAFNDETNLVAHDRALGGTLERLFEQDMARSREFHLDEFRRRPWHRRIAEQFFHLLSRIL